jgi:hypothetical protein
MSALDTWGRGTTRIGAAAGVLKETDPTDRATLAASALPEALRLARMPRLNFDSSFISYNEFQLQHISFRRKVVAVFSRLVLCVFFLKERTPIHEKTKGKRFLGSRRFLLCPVSAVNFKFKTFPVIRKREEARKKPCPTSGGLFKNCWTHRMLRRGNQRGSR